MTSDTGQDNRDQENIENCLLFAPVPVHCFSITFIVLYIVDKSIKGKTSQMVKNILIAFCQLTGLLVIILVKISFIISLNNTLWVFIKIGSDYWSFCY